MDKLIENGDKERIEARKAVKGFLVLCIDEQSPTDDRNAECGEFDKVRTFTNDVFGILRGDLKDVFQDGFNDLSNDSAIVMRSLRIFERIREDKGGEKKHKSRQRPKEKIFPHKIFS